MSLFGSIMGDFDDDPFFGSHMRQMRQMNNMMNSLLADPFGMFGANPLAITSSSHGGAMMPFMPQMPSLNRLFSADLSDGMGVGSSYSSRTVVMSSGPGGKPQVYSSSSSTKIGANGVKETRNTLQDSRTGTKKLSIGHHIGDRGHVIEREHNLYSGDQEEHQEFINIEEDEAEQFDREFVERSGGYRVPRGQLGERHSPQRHALPAIMAPNSSAQSSRSSESRRLHNYRPSPRRAVRTTASPLTHSSPSASVREVYGSSHPQRNRHKQYRQSRHNEN